MTMWILIFWMAIDRGGGPAAVNGFETEQACHAAAAAIKQEMVPYTLQFRELDTSTLFKEGRTYKPYVCVPNR